MSNNVKTSFKRVIAALVLVAAMLAMSACSGAKVEVVHSYSDKASAEIATSEYGESTVIGNCTLIVCSDKTYQLVNTSTIYMYSMVLGSYNTTRFGTYTVTENKDEGTATYTLSVPTRICLSSTVPTTEVYRDTNDAKTCQDTTPAEVLAAYTEAVIVVNVDSGIIISETGIAAAQ